ncbi:kynurenine 3-monooxygenase [Annulohypoxylon bovei var. microspora]|nr:kynurenine 3-monooxygenase [Annulohypoxylon bovei var. microspora]
MHARRDGKACREANRGRDEALEGDDSSRVNAAALLEEALYLAKSQQRSVRLEARSEEGGGIMLSPNVLRVLDSVGVCKRVCDNSLQFDNTDKYYFGYEAIRIMRKELLDEMKAMLRERHIPIHYESKLTTITNGPNKGDFTFPNGQTASAPILIGANGIHSTVCGTFLPEVRPIYAGFMGINSVVKRSQLRIPDGYNLPATVTAKLGAFLLVLQRLDGSELFDKQKLYGMLQENKTDWLDVVQFALEAVPVDRMGFWAFYGISPLESWLSESKRIILVGDAAHIIPPTACQSANQTFKDVRGLATLISKLSPDVPLDRAAAQWKACRQGRIKKVLDLTQKMNAKRLPESERAKLPPGEI